MRRRLPRRAEGAVGSNAAFRWGTPDLPTPVRAVAKSGVGAAPVRTSRWDWGGLLGWAFLLVGARWRYDNGRAHGLRRRLPNRFHSEESDSSCARVTRRDPSVNWRSESGRSWTRTWDLFLIRQDSAWHARTRGGTGEQQIPARGCLSATSEVSRRVPVRHLGVSEKCPRRMASDGPQGSYKPAAQ